MKGILFLFLAAIFCVLPNFAHSGIEINEIMYDLPSGSDDGREWVEVFNNSDTEVDFSAFRFFEADTNHKIIFVQGEPKLLARSYAVIVSNPEKFKNDWPSLSGITASSGTPPKAVAIFDSTFSLNNSGEKLILKDGDNVLDEYNYHSNSGGAGDGKSLQKINGVWVSSVPTPGAVNKITYTPPPPAPPSQSVPAKVSTKQKNLPEETPREKPSEEKIPIPDLPETALEDNEIEEENNSYLFSIILIPFIGAGAGAVYFVRRRKKISCATGDDFEILEEG